MLLLSYVQINILGPWYHQGQLFASELHTQLEVLSIRTFLPSLSKGKRRKETDVGGSPVRSPHTFPISRSSLYVIVKDKEFCDANFSFYPSESGSQRSVRLHYLYLKWNPLYPGLFPVLGPFDHL